MELALLLEDLGEHEEARRIAARAAATGHPMGKAVDACWRWHSSHDPSLESLLREAAEDWYWARLDLAELLNRAGRVDEEQEVLEVGVARGQTRCWHRLGLLHFLEGDDPEAAEVALRSGIAAGDDGCHFSLAALLEGRDDLDEAVSPYRLGAAAGDELAVEALQRLSAVE